MTMRLAERLRFVRERLGITQAEAVRRMRGPGINAGLINDLEHGRRDNLTLFTLARVARGYGMSVGELLYGVDVPLEEGEASEG